MDKFLDKFADIPALYKYLGAGGFAVLCVALFVWQVVMPKNEQIKSLEAELQKLQIELQKAEAYAARYDEFKEELRQVDLKLKEALKKLPEGKDIPNLLEQINGSVLEAGLTISLFQPAGQVPMEFYSEVPVTIQVSGGYHNFATFADFIGKMERIVTLRNIVLSPQGDGTLLSISCTAVTFRQATPQG